jgi:hypothetical protein
MRISSLALCLGMCSAIPAAANTILGLPADSGTGNSFPFGSAYSGEYEQVYTKGAFPGTMTVTGLMFFNTQFNSHATSLNTGTWTISLSTTSADWNTLSGTFAANIGGDNTQVFSGNIGQPWTFGDTLTINFSTPYTYNPANGNLLMDVLVTGASAPGGSVFFDTNGYNAGGFNGNTIMGRVYGGGSVNSGYGLVTDFVTSNSSIPEPSSALLIAAGLIGLSGLRRRNFRSQK